MDPALFSAGNLFGGEDSDDSVCSDGESSFVERDHEFPGMSLKIREFAFHQVNANLLWPGTRIFAEWLIKHPNLLCGRKILELGSGTGALTIFLKKTFDLDITTSDYDDEDIENNICHNCTVNNISAFPHIRHTWGEKFPRDSSDWDLILASDILLYVKQYSNLIKTLCFLLQTWKPNSGSVEDIQAGEHLSSNLIGEVQSDSRKNLVVIPESLPKPCFLMSWRRRIPKEDEDLFFNGCKAANLLVADFGARVYINWLQVVQCCQLYEVAQEAQVQVVEVLHKACKLMEDEATSSSAQQYAQEGVLPHGSIPLAGRMALTKFKSPCARLAWLTYQGKEKHINAQKDVLSTYHDSYLYGKVPLTIKVRAAIRGWPLSTLLLWLEFLAAMVSVVLYIISTYTVARITEEKEWIRVVEFACGLFFVVDYLIKVYSAPVRLYYIFSGRGLVDIISTIPILFSLSARERYSGAEILLFLRALRVMPVITSVGGFTGSIREQIFILVMYTLGVVFIAGGLLQWVEYRATPQRVREKLNCRPEGCMSFFEALYFMIVTVSTVGYGDVTLKSDWGRVVIVCAIVTALVILPLQINGILQLASRRPYGGNFAVKKVVGSRFIIVSGYLSYRTIQDFLAEFYHPNHNKDLRAFPLRVVVMAPFKPSFELKSLLMYYKGKAEFIEGTPVKGSDLNRVSADVASAFYLLANQQAKDPDAEDAAQIVRALSVYRHCGPGVRVIVELLKPEKQNNAVWDDTKEGIEIVCPDVIRFKLLARSCHVKGLSTFIVNLFRTGLTMTKPSNWMEQYGHGLCQEVFPVILPDCFHQEGFSFEQVAELAYCGYGIILFGLDIATTNYNSYQAREVLLCPIGRTIQVTDVGLVIAKNLEAAEALSKFSRSCHAEPSNIPNHATMTSHCASFKMQTRPSGPRSMSLNTAEETTLLPGIPKTFGEVELIDVEEPRIGCLLNLANPTEEVSERQRGRQSHNPKLLEPSIQLNGRGSLKSSFAANVHHAESLEEMMNFAMSWPPLQTDTKPEQPVLEQQTQKIQDNLDERKLHVVKLQEPHILLCIQGKWPVSLFYFMQLLRTPVMPNSPIVILHPNDPKPADWGCVGLFAHVYFVKGSPLYELDLLRAGVMQAEKVVILTQGIQLEQNSLEIANDQDRLIPSQTFSLDVNNLIIAATVERLLVPSTRVMVELQQEAEIQYLRPKLQFDRKRFDQGMYRRNQAATFQFAPPYIEGKGFCPATLGFLMYATFYNRHTVTIVEQLLCGDTVYSATKGDCKGNASTHNYSGSGNLRKLDQIHVPEEYVGKTFKDAFVGMLMNAGIMALGLYRALGTSGSIVSFVYTNPSPTTILFHDDLIYAIC